LIDVNKDDFISTRYSNEVGVYQESAASVVPKINLIVYGGNFYTLAKLGTNIFAVGGQEIFCKEGLKCSVLVFTLEGASPNSKIFSISEASTGYNVLTLLTLPDNILMAGGEGYYLTFFKYSSAGILTYYKNFSTIDQEIWTSVFLKDNIIITGDWT